MAIPITIEKLLNDNIVESARIEFKECWNPDTTLKTISAFANDIDNWGGGYIVIGAGEKDGKLLRPVTGLKENEIDHIQKELLRYCKYLKPAYIPLSEPVYYEDKLMLLVWCPGGYDRPYQCPKTPSSEKSGKTYYIRKLSSTIEATELDVKELLSLSHNIPFDDRVHMRSELKDLKYPLILNYLQEVDSSLLENIDNKTVKDLASDLRIADGPPEYFKPLNVGLLFFNNNPEKYFPYARIETVNIPDPTGQGMEERYFSGPIDRQLRDALEYIRNTVIAEKIFKFPYEAESKRIFNYPYAAIEEFISNAVFHKSYQIQEPVTIRIEKDQIEITSIPGPDRSISDEDIKALKMRTKRYRNRRIGEFLKELHLIEGRNTGIPAALKAIESNGSPLPVFLTDEDRSFFSVILPIHEAFKSEPENESVTHKKRRTRNEIQELILSELAKENMSARELYSRLGYSGNPSKTFNTCLGNLINDNVISYIEENLNSSTNMLKISELP